MSTFKNTIKLIRYSRTATKCSVIYRAELYSNDVRILNELNEHSDIFGLLYLKNVLETGQVLIDREPDVRSDFLERYGFRFRECEGLIKEVLA